MDDWETPKNSLIMLNVKTGKVDGFEFNPFKIEFQLTTYLLKQYGHTKEFMAHSVRFLNILSFQHNYEKRLLRSGLLRKGAEGIEIHKALLKSLCILPYSNRKVTKDGTIYRFSYTQVVEKANAFIKSNRW